MKDKIINLIVDDQFKEDLEKLAKIKKFSDASEMIIYEYGQQIDGINNMVENQDYIFNFLPIVNKLYEDVLSSYNDEDVIDDVIMKELIEFIFEYMLTNQEALNSLFNKVNLVRAKQK